MNWVDILVVLLAISIAVIGARQGLVVTVPAIALLIAGAVVGIRVAPSLLEHVDGTALRAALSVGVPVLFAALGETFGVYLGRLIKSRIRNRHVSGLDNSLGAILQAAVVLVVGWFVLLALTGMPGMPGLVSAINSSRVLGAVNSVMPDGVRQLPNGLRKQLDFSDFPATSTPFTRTPIGEVGAPDGSLSKAAVVRQVRPSVVKIRGTAPSCSRALEGSGFVVSPQHVMTNAHVVAGTSSVSVETPRGPLAGQVVHYDPQTDVAVLNVPGLSAPVLRWSTERVVQGADVIVLGYPLDGPYTAAAGKVREQIALRGPNIYDNRVITRQVYTVRAQVRSGNSGGPLITPNGEVAGVIFGAAVDDRETGFALTQSQVSTALEQGSSATARVETGSCAA